MADAPGMAPDGAQAWADVSGQPTQPAAPAPQAQRPTQGDPVVYTMLGEAGSDPHGLNAVGWTIANRARQFGKSPQDIVTDPAQGYEAWNDAKARARTQQSYPVGSPQYLAAQQTISDIQSGKASPLPYTHFYSPTAQAAKGRPVPDWAKGDGVDIGGNRFYALGSGNQAPGAMGADEQAAWNSVQPEASGLQVAPSKTPGSGTRSIVPAHGGYQDQAGNTYQRDPSDPTVFTDKNGAKYTIDTGEPSPTPTLGSGPVFNAAVSLFPPLGLVNTPNFQSSLGRLQSDWKASFPTGLGGALGQLGTTPSSGALALGPNASTTDRQLGALAGANGVNAGGEQAAAIDRLQGDVLDLPVSAARGALSLTGMSDRTAGGILAGAGALAPVAHGLAREFGPGLEVGANAPSLATGIDPATPVTAPIAQKAAQYVRTLIPEGATPAAIDHPDAILADHLGTPGQLALRAAASKSPATAAALQTRNEALIENLPNQAAAHFSDAAGIAPDVARSSIGDLVTAGRQAAGPLYDEAYSLAPHQGPQLASLLERPSLRRAMGGAVNLAAEQGRDPMALGFRLEPDGSVTGLRNPSNETLDYVKRGLDDILEDSRNQLTGKLPGTAQVRAMLDTRKDLMGVLTADTEAGRAYQAALRKSGDYMSAQDAYDRAHTGLFNDRLPAEDFNRFHVTNASEADLAASRAGAARAIFDLQQTGKLAPKAFTKPIVQQKIVGLLGEDAGNRFLGQVDNLGALQSNARLMDPRINSPTAGTSAALDAQDVSGRSPLGRVASEMGSDALVGTALSHGNPLGGVGYAFGKQAVKLAAKGGDLLTGGMSAPVREEVGRLLMSKMTPEQAVDYIRQATAKPVSVRASGIPLSQMALPPRNGVLSSYQDHP